MTSTCSFVDGRGGGGGAAWCLAFRVNAVLTQRFLTSDFFLFRKSTLIPCQFQALVFGCHGGQHRAFLSWDGAGFESGVVMKGCLPGKCSSNELIYFALSVKEERGLDSSG